MPLSALICVPFQTCQVHSVQLLQALNAQHNSRVHLDVSFDMNTVSRDWLSSPCAHCSDRKFLCRHMEKLKARDWRRIFLYLQPKFFIHLHTCQNLFYNKFLLLVLLPSCSTTILPPPWSTLTSSHPSLSPTPSPLPSILHSLRQTIKQAFPWLTHDSPLPPHHPKSQTEGELQPQIQCGAE